MLSDALKLRLIQEINENGKQEGDRMLEEYAKRPVGDAVHKLASITIDTLERIEEVLNG